MVGEVFASLDGGLLDEGFCVKAPRNDTPIMDLLVHYQVSSHQRNQSAYNLGRSDEGDRDTA